MHMLAWVSWPPNELGNPYAMTLIMEIYH